MTYAKFITTVKEIVSKQPIPPHYNPDEYSNKSFNCYAYALQICIDCSDFLIYPGFFSNSITTWSERQCSKEFILEYFKKDCEV